MNIPNNAQSLTIEETFEKLDTSQEGISSKEAERRINIFGKNLLKDEKTSNISIFLKQFKDPVIYILIFASILAFYIGDIKDFFLIIGIVFINSFLGFWQELKTEKSLKALRKLTEHRVRILRDGKVFEIPSLELVPGDFVILSEGDVVSADLRLIESNSLLINESTITGESMPAEKDASYTLPENTLPYDLKNMALSGTFVVKGSGKAIVVKTGGDTYLASIAEKVQEESPDSPLTRAIAIFSKRFIIFLMFLLFLIGIIGTLQGREFSHMMYILVALLVSAVPEGLPIVVTLVLAIGALMLNKKQVLVRHLPSVETLGSTTVIASDKTGTITEGKIVVKDVFSPNIEEVKLVAALANEAGGDGKGDPIDVALANWLSDEYNDLRNKYPQIFIHPFDTKLRMMASVNKSEKKCKGHEECKEDREQLFVKGSYEFLKEKATNKEEFKTFDKIHDKMAENGLRVLAFGIGEDSWKSPDSWKFRIVGLIGFLDPPKEGVKEAVLTAKAAGIRVIMITGDYPLTARAIAREIGIYEKGDRVLTGKEIEDMDDKTLISTLKNTSVIARALPEHKFRIVKTLQEDKEIVAVTGDGVNDVPALKVADLGIAMGGGTEAAKSVSKMIITDNNLKVIVNAIKQGRVISNNIRKVIYYLVSTNLGEILLISSAIILGLNLPLYPTQILWINIVADGVQDKTFPFIKEEGNVMKKKPVKLEDKFLDKFQILRILYTSVVIAIINLILYIYMLKNGYPYGETITTVFTSMVVSQWFNGIQAQKESEPFFKNIKRSLTINPYIWLGNSVGIVLQFMAIYVFSDLFHTVHLTIQNFVFVFIATILFFMAVELRKWIEYFLQDER